MVIDEARVITWNAFEGQPEGHKTIGFLSRISPDGRFALTTLNESVYLNNFADYRVLRAFCPTRGILAWHATETGAMKARPGADDPALVHTNGVWSPDGKWIVFTNCRNRQLLRPDGRLSIDPFQGGEVREMRGNTRLMSSWYAFSPDGRWMVFSS